MRTYQKPQKVKQIIVSMMSFLVLFQGTTAAYAAPMIVHQTDNKKISPTKTKKMAAKSVKDDGSGQFIDNSNVLSNSMMGASVSGNDLSASYNIGIITTNLYPNQVNSGITFALNTFYNSNNPSDYWGVGIGFALNIPTLSFGEWVKSCHGKFNTDHNSGNYQKCEGSSASGNITTQKVDNFPKYINYSSGAGNVTFKLEASPTATSARYIPFLLSATNSTMRISAIKDGDNYTFEADTLNNKNNFTKFFFNAAQNSNIKNPANGELVAVRSETYNNSIFPIKIDYINGSDLTRGLMIYGSDGSKTDGAHNIRLEGVYPNYEGINQQIQEEAESKSAIGCFVSHIDDKGGHEFLRDKFSWYDSIPATASVPDGMYDQSTVNYNNCPPAALDLATYGKYNEASFSDWSQSQGAQKLIKGVNLVNKPIQVSLNLEPFDQKINNLLSDGGVGLDYINGTYQSAISHDGERIFNDTILDYVVIAKSTAILTGHKLSSLSWKSSGGSELQSMNLSYGLAAPTANHLSDVGRSFYGSSSNNRLVPLLTKVDAKSLISPMPKVEFTYNDASYNTYYGMKTLVSLGNDDPLTEVLNNRMNDFKNIEGTGELKFKYVSSMKVTDGLNNSQTSTYNWGDNKHNINKIYDSTLLLNVSDANIAYKDSVIRGASNFYATTDNLGISANDLKTAGYSTKVDNGQTLSITEYNRYGSPIKISSCPSGTTESDLTNCDITQFHYEKGGIIDSNSDLTPDIKKPYNMVDSADFFHGSIKLNSISSIYNDKGLPQTIVYYTGDGALSSILKMSYDTDKDGYFNLANKAEYSRPFTVSDITNPSAKSFTKTNYSYGIKNVSNHNYALLEDTITNISGAKASQTMYGYDDSLRLKDSTTCINPANGDAPKDCTLNKPADRYTSTSTMTYSDTDNSIITKTSSTGSGQISYYIPGTSIVQKQISANGTQVDYTYDDYGRVIDSKTTLLGAGKPVVVSDNQVKYDIEYANGGVVNASTVMTTDTYGNKMLNHYNVLGQLDCSLSPNSSISSGGSPEGGYSHQLAIYSYNKQGQLESTLIYSMPQAPTSCDLTGGTLLSQVNKSYDYKGRVIDSVSTIPAFGERKQYQTKTHYEYTYSVPSSGFWSYLWSFFNKTSGKVITTTKADNLVNYNNTSWENIGSSSLSKDVFNSNSTTTLELPHEKPMISNTEVSYDTDPNSKKVLSVHSSEFGKPDSNIEYGILGQVLNQQVVSKDGTIVESMSYNYDDLERVIGVNTNNDKTLPYSLSYDNDGLVSQQLYNYQDSNVAKKRLTDYTYTDTCLLPSSSGLCSDKSFQQKQLSLINIFPDATKNNLDVNKPYKGAGDIIQSHNYSYDNYGLDNSELLRGKKGNITYTTTHDENNHLRTKHTEQKDSNKVVTYVDYQYYSNGSLSQQTIDQGNGKQVTKTLSYNGDDYNNINQSVQLSSAQSSGDDSPIKFSSTLIIDPGTGSVLKTHFKNLQQQFGAKFDHTTQYFYDNKLRLNKEQTRGDGGAGVYKETVYNYCDDASDKCLYGSLIGVTHYNTMNSSNSSDINSFVAEHYTYDKSSNKLSSRSLTYQTADIQGVGNIENYEYDGLYRLHNYKCSPLSDDYSMCAGDNLSGGKAIQQRVYEYDNSNNIHSVSTTDVNNKNYSYIYHYDEDNNQLLSVEDASTKNNLFSLSYDPAMGWVKSFQQGNAASKDFRNINYDYSTDGLVSSVSSKTPTGDNISDENIKVSHGIGGINKINYPGYNERQYFGDGLYKQIKTGSYPSTGTFLGIGNDSSPDYILAINREGTEGNDIDEVFKGLNGRVLATGGHGIGGTMLNSYTPYGQMLVKFLDGDSDPYVEKSRTLVHGENGALTISGSLKGSQSEQYQVLGSRIYMPQIGRFLEQDSASPFGGGGPNAYMYSPANPVGFADPSGHFGSVFSNSQFGDYNSVYNPDNAWQFGMQLFLSVVFLPLTFEFSEISIPAIIGMAAGGMAVASSTLELVGSATNNSNLSGIGEDLGWAALGTGLAAAGAAAGISAAAARVGAREAEVVLPEVSEAAADTCPGGKCGSACFTESTNVLIRNTTGAKEMIKIKDIKLGSMAVTYDTESAESSISK